MAVETSWFWPQPEPLAVSEVAALCGAELWRDAPPGAEKVRRVAPFDAAGPGDVTFLDNPKYLDRLPLLRASAVIVGAKAQDRVPLPCAVLVAAEPARAFAALVSALYPLAMRPGSMVGVDAAISPQAFLHPQARLERDVTVDPGASIGSGAEIGRGTVIASGAVVGPGVKIGRECSIGAAASVQHALVGNRVILHPGVRIGQDGFGYRTGPKGHAKSPQIGRVILQDDVEIGANSTVDRGALGDTVIGEGTKIDNLVQIAHNVAIGRHCIIVAQVGIAGSATLKDFVVIGGQVGVIGHISIGEGAQIAATSNVASDVPAGARWGGTPARPVKEWMREVLVLRKLAAGRGGGQDTDRDKTGQGRP